MRKIIFSVFTAVFLLFMLTGFTTKSALFPELKALNKVKYHIDNGDDSIFEPLDAERLSYQYKESNYKIEYSHVLDGFHYIQEYEFVIDGSADGTGHTVTSQWYMVDAAGEISLMFDYDPADSINNPILAGYWHSEPEYGQGKGKSYKFFNDGLVYYYEDNEEIFEGEWRVSASGELEISIFNTASGGMDVSAYTFEYFAEDAETGDPSVVINNERFWQMNKPTDIIDGKPLYINYNYNLEITDYRSRSVINSGQGSEHVIIYSDAELYDLKITNVDYNFDSSEYSAGDIIFSMDKLPADIYIEYATYIPEIVSNQAVSFSDKNGKVYTYLLSYNGRDGSTCTVPVFNF